MRSSAHTFNPPCIRRKRRDDNVRWAESMAAMPAWVFATAHDVTVEQAERIQHILGDLAGQAGAR